jgi:hypothetical protein
LTSFPAFGFRPVPDIGVLFGAFEEFIARIALQDVPAFLKINHAIAARQESARPRLKSYLKHVTLLLADEGSVFEWEPSFCPYRPDVALASIWYRLYRIGASTAAAFLREGGELSRLGSRTVK